MQVAIYPSYSNGCFCDRPALEVEVVATYQQRMWWQNSVKAVAAKLGATEPQIGTGASGKSAYAQLPVACAHRPAQDLRFDWRIIYK